MSNPDVISHVRAREILNFLGNPTVEAEVSLSDGSCGDLELHVMSAVNFCESHFIVNKPQPPHKKAFHQ